MFSENYTEALAILHRMAQNKEQSQTHEYKHPSGVIEVSVTPPNDEDETESYQISLSLWNGTHHIHMETDSLAAAAALVASLMCMKSDVEAE